MNDFGIKITNCSKQRRELMPFKKMLKLNGEEITEWDLKFLYTHGEKLDFIQISELFDVPPKLVSKYIWFYGINPRNQDKILRREWYKEERISEEKEKLISRQIKAKKIMEGVKELETVIINGKRYVDSLEKEERKEMLTDAMDMVGRLELSEMEDELEARECRYPVELSAYRNVHLIALRAYRHMDRMQFSKLSKLDFNQIRYFELNQDAIIPKFIERTYVQCLRLSRREIKKVIDVLAGKRELNEEEFREIPVFIRSAVWRRDKGKCTNCLRDKYLHYHHIKHFSDGGMHTIKNIKLLCILCHAEEHKEDKSYYMLKSLSQKLLEVKA